MVTRPGNEVDVVGLERDQLPRADAGLEHESDDGLVAAVLKGLVRPEGGRGAGGDQGAELVVGERYDERVALWGSLDPEEGIGAESAEGDEPGGVPADRELTGPGGPRGCAGVEHLADPGGERGPGHRSGAALGAPGEVGLHAVGVDRDGRRGLVLGA